MQATVRVLLRVTTAIDRSSTVFHRAAFSAFGPVILLSLLTITLRVYYVNVTLDCDAMRSI